MLQWIIEQSLCFLLPFSPFPFAPHSSPLTYLEPSLLWQDPSTSFPGCSWTDLPISLPLFIYPSFQNPDPRGFPDPNIHSLGQHRESGSQDPAQLFYSILLTICCQLILILQYADNNMTICCRLINDVFILYSMYGTPDRQTTNSGQAVVSTTADH